MLQKTAVIALSALLLLGCTTKSTAPADEAIASSPAPTAVVYAVGSSEGNETLVLAAPTASNTPAPIGKVEYHAEEGAHYETLADKTVSITGGLVEITVTGMAFSNPVQCSDGGSVRLILQNGATCNSALSGESMADVSVTLDATSNWTLVSDTRVDALCNGDAAFTNVSSNGFALSYNCENEENAYLARAALSLPGGGQLTPVI